MENVIRAFWAANHTATPSVHSVHTECPLVKCVDGFQMSVQASSFHYCAPRDYVEDGGYAAWEIGFPSDREDMILEWVEDASDPTGTVYGYVPTETVNAVIAKHGGLAPATTDQGLDLCDQCAAERMICAFDAMRSALTTASAMLNELSEDGDLDPAESIMVGPEEVTVTRLLHMIDLALKRAAECVE